MKKKSKPMFYVLLVFISLIFHENIFSAMDQQLVSRSIHAKPAGQYTLQDYLNQIGIHNDAQTIIAEFLSWEKIGELKLPTHLNRSELKSPQILLSPDGKYIALKHLLQRMVHAWSIPDLNYFCLPLKDTIEHLTVLPDNKIAFFTRGLGICVYDFITHKQSCLMSRKQLGAVGYFPKTFSLSNSGHYLAVCDEAREIHLVNLFDNHKIQKITSQIDSYAGPLENLKFSVDEKYLAISVPICGELYTVNPFTKYLEFRTPVTYITDGDNNFEPFFSNNSTYFAHCRDLDTVHVIDLKTKKILSKITSPNYELKLLHFYNAKANSLSLAKKLKNTSNGIELQTWDIQGRLLASQYLNKNLAILKGDIAASENGLYMTESNDNTHYISILRNDKNILRQVLPDESCIVSESSKPCELPVNYFDVARIFDKAEIRQIIYDYLDSFDDSDLISRSIFQENISISPSGNYIATYESQSKTIKLWHSHNKQYCKTLVQKGQNDITEVVFSVDERYLVINFGKTIILYDILEDTSKVIAESKNDEIFEKVKFSANDAFILALQGKVIYLYEIATDRNSSIHLNNNLNDTNLGGFGYPGFDFENGEIHDIAWTNNGLNLCMSLKRNACTKNNVIVGFNLNKFAIESSVSIDQNISKGSFSQNGRYFCGTIDYILENGKFGLVKVWDSNSGTPTNAIPYQNITPRVALSPRGGFLNIYTPIKLMRFNTDTDLSYSLINETGENNQKLMQFSAHQTHAICPLQDNTKKIYLQSKQNLGRILTVFDWRYQNLTRDFNDAASKNDHTAVTKLLKLGIKPDDWNKRESDWPPLFTVILNKNLEILELLLAANVDVNRTFKSISSLMLAVNKKSEPIILLLLAHKAQVNYQVPDWDGFYDYSNNAPRFEMGDTALIQAARLQLPKIVKLLLEHDADRSIKNKKGKTALDYARKTGNQEVIRLLSEASCTIQ